MIPRFEYLKKSSIAICLYQVTSNIPGVAHSTDNFQLDHFQGMHEILKPFKNHYIQSLNH